MNSRMFLIVRIVFTMFFCTISTIIWFTRKVEIYHEVKSSVIFNDVTVSDLKKVEDSDNRVYNLKIENKDETEKNIKVYIVRDVIGNCIENNYIKYQINNENVKTLNMDGVIMISKLEGLETRDINLKLWISDTYTGNLNYDGRIVVA